MEIKTILSKYPSHQRDNLLPILQEVQEVFSYLSEDHIIAIGAHLKLPTCKIYGVATFFDQFRFSPQGKYHIQVCNGASCYLAGNQNVLAAIKKNFKISPGKKTANEIISLELVPCLGACACGPVVKINDEVHAEMGLERNLQLLERLKESV